MQLCAGAWPAPPQKVSALHLCNERKCDCSWGPADRPRGGRGTVMAEIPHAGGWRPQVCEAPPHCTGADAAHRLYVQAADKLPLPNLLALLQ